MIAFSRSLLLILLSVTYLPLQAQAQTAAPTPTETIPDLRLPGFSESAPANAPAVPSTPDSALPLTAAPAPLLPAALPESSPSALPASNDTDIKVKIPSVTDNAAPINGIPTPLAETATPADGPATPPDGTEPAKAASDNSPVNLSLMFDAAQIARVNQVLKAFDNGLAVGIQDDTPAEKSQDETLNDILNEMKATEANAAPKYYPNFILTSLVYYHPDDWTVWLTGVKITAKNNKPENPVYIKSITPGSITLTWKPVDSIRPSLQYVWNKKKTSKKDKQETKFISVNANASSIAVVLRPNQTFIAGYMTIREGIITQIATPAVDQAAVAQQALQKQQEPSAIDAMQEPFPDAVIEKPLSPSPAPQTQPNPADLESIPGVFPGSRSAITNDVKGKLSPLIPDLLNGSP